jgi:hypothetical protein
MQKQNLLLAKVRDMKRIVCMGLASTLMVGVLTLTSAAQMQAPANSQDSSTSSASSGSSLGDYAKQIRKKSDNVSKPKVFDNDNLPKEDKLSIVGNATEASSEESSAAKAEEQAAPATTGENKQQAASGETAAAKTPEQEQADKEAAWKQWGEKINSQKEQIDLLARELDVLQREYQLRAAAMYGDAGNRLRNQADWDKQDAQYKQQIADKQKALDDAKQKLDDMQEDARKAGVPDSVREP